MVRTALRRFFILQQVRNPLISSLLPLPFLVHAPVRCTRVFPRPLECTHSGCSDSVRVTRLPNTPFSFSPRYLSTRRRSAEQFAESLAQMALFDPRVTQRRLDARKLVVATAPADGNGGGADSCDHVASGAAARAPETTYAGGSAPASSGREASTSPLFLTGLPTFRLCVDAPTSICETESRQARAQHGQPQQGLRALRIPRSK